MRKVEIKKLREKVFYNDVFTGKRMRVKYVPEQYSADEVMDYLSRADLFDNIYICDNQERYMFLEMYPDDEYGPRSYKIAGEEYDDITEVRKVLETNGFIRNGQLTVFAVMDCNAPTFLRAAIDQLNN